jgi:hexosaminidase
MSPYRRWIGLAACIVALTQAAACNAQSLSVLPIPLSVINEPGTLTIADGATLAYPKGDRSAAFSANHLSELVQQMRHLHLVSQPGSNHAAIVLVRTTSRQDSAVSDESYDLHVTPQRVTISASTDAGLYYGTVTLWQMLTAGGITHGPANLQCLQIHDAPQLRWRGLMLDSARHMQTIDEIRHLIDWMSLEKLNTLHWHLTDDQGWRLEIKRYPKLTQIGAWRELRKPGGAMTAADLQSHRYGGFYTQEQVRSLVAYAAARNVTIVPEIEMPGHASAPLAAYPQFGSTEEHLKAPANEYGIFPYLYNVNDDTFTFIENVLTEVMQLFPTQYIHVGGDEAIKDQWKASATIQAQMKTLGILDEDALQSYFIKRIDTFLTAHGRRTIGWDEILQGGLAPNAAVMSWHGVDGGINAAKQGHDAVLTPVRPLYFNYRQSDAADEAPGRFTLNTLANVYAFNPLPDSLTADQRQHILGVQGNLWSEYVISADRLEWMLYPRTAALAEISWSAADRRDWKGFLPRLEDEMGRYKLLGIRFDPAAFKIRSAESFSADHQHVTVSLSNQAAYGTIRYTTDGSTVTASSQEYSTPFSVPLPSHLRAAAFSQNEIISSELDRTLDPLSVRKRFSQELKLCQNDPAIAMEPDPEQAERPVVLANYVNPCWIYRAADLDNITGISAGVVPLPYVFRDKNNKPPPLGTPHTQEGELEVHLDHCDGPLAVALPLAPAAGRDGVTQLHATLAPLHGIHDLCLQVVRPHVDPLWVLDWVQLEPAGEPKP